jgi:hypothetical protein
MPKKLTTQQFIQRSQTVHGDRYNYSQTQFCGADKKITIICNIHGAFEQRAMDHMKGRGCSLCNERQSLTLQQFIERSNKKHKSKYTYENVVYKNVHTKVNITCPVHGIFSQTPTDHVHGGYGCPVCGGTGKVSTKDFVHRSSILHVGKYDYSKTISAGMNKKVIITCKDHGNFSQRAADHANGVGCPSCGIQHQKGYTNKYFEKHPEVKAQPAKLYLITIDDAFCKIGITRKQYIKQRFSGVRFKVVAELPYPLYKAFQQEQTILKKFHQERYKVQVCKNKYFTGWTECFPLSLLSALKLEIIKD